ncbi:hypothetical protein DSO57_1033370 [Entomophthora muscae]|uniref:Uncharacterized protein n=1 Tax=Entomophthora muscae TaxID=34485 RepID=A0ACC2SPA3_9FUNG|nr:hypothetical protein DSO57_1033370 [Entomophthora muscae]
MGSCKLQPPWGNAHPLFSVGLSESSQDGRNADARAWWTPEDPVMFLTMMQVLITLLHPLYSLSIVTLDLRTLTSKTSKPKFTTTYLLYLQKNLPKKANDLLFTGETLVHSLTCNNVEFSLPTEAPISLWHEDSHVPHPWKLWSSPQQCAPNPKSAPQAQLLACFGYAFDGPQFLPPSTVPFLSSHPSSALDGILVGFPARM